MTIVRGNWPDYVRPGARKAFSDAYPLMEAQYVKFFNIMTSQRAWEEDLVKTGLGTAGLKPEAQDVPMDEPVPRGKVRYTHLTYGLGYEISREMVEDDLYAIVAPRSSRDLATSIRDTEERTAAAVFNLAFSTQQAYDGVSLINTAHPTVPGTIANRPAADIDLSVAGLQAALDHFNDLENDRGIKIRLNPKMVVVHPSNIWAAHEILNSEFVPYSADNTRNIIAQQGLVPVAYNYLTDADAWYVITEKSQHHINFFWRRKPLFEDAFDERAGVAFYMVTARFSVGVTDWRGIYGSSGA